MPKKPARKKRNYSGSKRKPSAKAKKRSSASDQKRQAKIKQIFAVSILLTVSTILLSGYLVYKKITQEFASALSTTSKNILSEDLFTSVFIVVDNFESEPLLVRKVSLSGGYHDRCTGKVF